MFDYDECQESNGSEDPCVVFGGVEFDPMSRVVRTYAQCCKEFEQELARLTDVTVRTYSTNQQPLFLLGKPRHGIYAQTAVGSECPEKWDVVVPEMVPQDLAVDQLRTWFRDRLKRVPLAVFSQ